MSKQEWKIGDCLDLLPSIDDESVNMICADLPYEQTKNEWDIIIDPVKLWREYNRIIKPNGAIILFGQGMFTAVMMQSNPGMWRYNLIWKKNDRVSGFLNAGRMPLRNHEDIMVFYKSLPTYNPQFRKGKPTHKKGKIKGETNNNYGDFTPQQTRDYGSRKYPLSVLDYPKPHPAIHPTQKPLKLIEYLIRTYTNEGDTVHDSCLGSGTTLEACLNTNRNCIGFEISNEWEEHYKNRLRLNEHKLDRWQ